MRWLLALASVCVACDGGESPPSVDALRDTFPSVDAFDGIPVPVYVGAADNRILIYRFDPQEVRLEPNGSHTTGAGPTFLAFDPNRRWLVTVNEGADAVESFAVAGDGTLTRVNAQPSMGSGPAHVAVDTTGHWVLVANYGSGTVAVLPIDASGTLGAAVATVNAGANAHQVVISRNNTIAYVPCLGANHIAVYNFDDSTGALTPRTPVAAPPNAGPRHLAVHPINAHAFVINELASSVTMYDIDGDGDLAARTTVSTLPSGFSGTNTGAEIAVHRSGQYVYASNRGHDSIVRFRYDGATLSEPVHDSIFGMRPRHFSFAQRDTVMFVAKQGSGGIHAFRVAGDGTLSPVGELATASGPAFVASFEFPGS